MGKIVAVCSGSGGAGKSTVALSLAVGAAKRGKTTILLDASGAARTCDLMLGLESVIVLDMMDVIKQQASIHTALYPVPGKERLRFACASLYEGTGLCDLSSVLLVLRAMCDMLVIDLPTGPVMFSEGVLDENDGLVLIARPDDMSIRALERMVSHMSATAAQRYLVINHVSASWVKRGYQYDRQRAEMLLDMPVACFIQEEEHVVKGIKNGRAAIESDGRIAAELNMLLKSLL